jgi:hypothetical protein
MLLAIVYDYLQTSQSVRQKKGQTSWQNLKTAQGYSLTTTSVA